MPDFVPFVLIRAYPRHPRSLHFFRRRCVPGGATSGILCPLCLCGSVSPDYSYQPDAQARDGPRLTLVWKSAKGTTSADVLPRLRVGLMCFRSKREQCE